METAKAYLKLVDAAEAYSLAQEQTDNAADLIGPLTARTAASSVHQELARAVRDYEEAHASDLESELGILPGRDPDPPLD